MTKVKSQKVNWFCYLLFCSDSTYYCGITNNLNNRIKKHNLAKGAKYTKTRLPVYLICSIELSSKSEALKYEFFIKSLKKKDKIKTMIDNGGLFNFEIFLGIKSNEAIKLAEQYQCSCRVILASNAIRGEVSNEKSIFTFFVDEKDIVRSVEFNNKEVKK